jgi:light-regulated signal transduction histidine kinase (bacteriophytochrome)
MLVNKNKELENYLYIASHDLRSPLVNIQGFSSRLGKQAEVINSLLSNCQMDKDNRIVIEEILSQKLPASLDYIFTNVSKMDFLISGLLQISRTGKVAMAIKQVDMNLLLGNILKSFDYEISEAKAEITLGSLHPCYGDENLLNQLFSNLISNAIKYRSENRSCKIKIESEGKYKKVIYKISDNGIGIAARHHEKIWNVFFRVNSGENANGEGIGLSLAKRIIDKHQGRIWVESKEDDGSIFFVELSNAPFNELK